MENQTVLEGEEKLQPKPLSKNAFAAFWQKLWRGWLGWWYGFADKHVKLAAWAYKIVFFIVFSMGVTVLQYIGFTLLPYAFGIQLAGTEFMWPHLKMATVEGKDLFWNILGYEISTKSGEVVIGGGLGYFISYELTVFIAQCINFPLQRNITFRSHGNPWYQAMWYFIGWVLISLLCNAVNGLWMPFAEMVMPLALYNLLVTFVTGAVSMFIFFFIFLVIFPDAQKTAASKKKKLESAEAAFKSAQSSADAQRIAKAQANYQTALKNYTVAEEMRRVFEAEKAMASARSLADSKINAYLGAKKRLAKAQAAGEETAELQSHVLKAREAALKAVEEREEIVPRSEEILKEVQTARESRAA